MTITDERLMEEVRQGAAAAFELLVQRWDRRMIGYFVRLAGNRQEAEDLRQELFLRLYQKRHLYKPGSAFQPWLYRMATNLAIDKVGRRRRPPTEPIDMGETGADTDARLACNDHARGAAERNETESLVEAALNALPGEFKAALVMRHFEQLSFVQIAEILEIPESTVKTRVYRGLTLLKKHLKPLGLLEPDRATA